MLLRRRIEEVGDDRALADVLRDVFLGVVGPHLLLVDVLLKDVAEHVGIDLVVVAKRSRIEVPIPLVEEGKQPLEGRVGDVELGVPLPASSSWTSKSPPFR